MFARVLPDQAAGKILDYRVPEAMSSKIAVGSRVKIPVRTRLLTGTVIELLDACEFTSVKDITDLVDERPMIRPALLELAYWMADYYCCPLETAVCSVLPVAVRDGRVTAKNKTPSASPGNSPNRSSRKSRCVPPGKLMPCAC